MQWNLIVMIWILAYLAIATIFYLICAKSSVLVIEKTKEAEIIHLFPNAIEERLAA